MKDDQRDKPSDQPNVSHRSLRTPCAAMAAIIIMMIIFLCASLPVTLVAEAAARSLLQGSAKETEKVGADVAATLIEGTPDAKGLTRSKLRIVTSLTEENPQKGIPEGLLAFLLFEVSPEA